MNAVQVGIICGRGGQAIHFAGQSCYVQQVFQPTFGLGVFWQASSRQGLHQTANGGGQGVVATGVPKAFFIPKESGVAHSACPSFHQALVFRFCQCQVEAFPRFFG